MNAPSAPRLRHSELTLAEVTGLANIRAEGLRDVVVPLAGLRLTEAGTVDVPGLGERALNTWSQKQLATRLGVNWRRWHSLTTPAERAEEATRRFTRTGGEIRVRVGGNGTIRAFAEPSFRPIEERRVFELLSRAARGLFDDVRFTRVEFGDVSHFTAARIEPVTAAGLSWRPGWHLAVSECGAGALTVDDAWTDAAPVVDAPVTILCAPGGKRALYRTHRPITDEALAAALTVALGFSDGRWGMERVLLDAAASFPVPYPRAAVEALLLECADVPRASLEAALARLGDPVDGASAPVMRLAVARAVAAAAPAEDLDARFAMERRAGDLVCAGGAS